MGLVQDLKARAAQLSRPRYGRELYFAGTELPDPSTEQLDTRHGRVRCLRYPGVLEATYLHLHGGAFITRYPEMDDFWARFVVATTGLSVVLPDYRVAPQVRYPVAHEQVQDLAAQLGPALLVGGFSSGGNLAASVARHVEVRGQLLGVPSLDVAEDVRTKCATAPGSMITPGLLDLVRATYFRDAARRSEPDASPLLAADVHALPPTMIVTAERDTLRREGDRYAARLAAAGVPVEHVVAPRVDHYFLHGAGPDRARALMQRMADWLAAQL